MATVPKSTVKPELTQRAKNLLAKAAQWQGSGVKVAPRARFPRHRCFICGGVGDNFYLLTKGDGSTALVGETFAAAADLAFFGNFSAAVLVSQRVIGTKGFGK